VQINGNAAIGYSASTAAPTNGMSISGSVGIGIVTPSQKLHVDSTTGDGIYISSFQTTTGAINTGASIFFAFNDGAGARDSGNIKLLKENGTSGNYASYMSFSTRPNGGAVTEAMKITSGGNLLVGTTTSNASAKVQIDSTTQGFLPPVMTTTQKNAITSPATGLIIFDSTLGKLCVFSTTWQTITSV